MTEIEQVKQETKERLMKLGYSEDVVNRLVNSFWRVCGKYQGKPTRVITHDGQEIIL